MKIRVLLSLLIISLIGIVFILFPKKVLASHCLGNFYVCLNPFNLQCGPCIVGAVIEERQCRHLSDGSCGPLTVCNVFQNNCGSQPTPGPTSPPGGSSSSSSSGGNCIPGSCWCTPPDTGSCVPNAGCSSQRACCTQDNPPGCSGSSSSSSSSSSSGGPSCWCLRDRSDKQQGQRCGFDPVCDNNCNCASGLTCVGGNPGTCQRLLPTCNIALLPDTLTIPAGADQIMQASIVSVSNGSITGVAFTSVDPSVATATSPDTSSPYTTRIDALLPNRQTVVNAVATAVGTGGTATCSDSSIIDVTPPLAWWQTRDGDVYTGGNIASLIPGTCTLPACNPVFSIDGVGGYPGLVIYGGTQFDFKSGLSNGTVSSKGWLANTTYQGSEYRYSFFERQIPSDVTINEITSDTVNGGDFNSGGAPSRGYVWYKRQGDLTINGNVNLAGSRKVILLVKGGNLNIVGRININDLGQGFFMAIVGKDASGAKGDIQVDPSVSNPSQPELEGIFLADSEFKTGVSDQQLHVRGSVAAWEGISLERDLQAGNLNTPSEYFEYAPEMVLTFPREFTRKQITWKEVSP